MKPFFLSVTLAFFSFLLWSALKPSKTRAGSFWQSGHQTTEKAAESMDDPKLPPLQDPWDRKWQI
jgi:hypothetical protein